MKFKKIIASAALLSALAAAPGAYAVVADDFVVKASVNNTFEILTARVALEKSHNEAVRTYARQMIADHLRSASQLRATLAKADIDAQVSDSVLDSEHQRKLDRLKLATEGDFDREYVVSQTDAHKEAVSLYRNYAFKGDEPALKRFASILLPTVKAHLRHVESLKNAS